ncbi:hypothetical protein INR49_026927, partial [Caranx melampygus]
LLSAAASPPSPPLPPLPLPFTSEFFGLDLFEVGFRLRLEASCPVTHSSEMTHLSSSQPTKALFHNATILFGDPLDLHTPQQERQEQSALQSWSHGVRRRRRRRRRGESAGLCCSPRLGTLKPVISCSTRRYAPRPVNSAEDGKVKRSIFTRCGYIKYRCQLEGGDSRTHPQRSQALEVSLIAFISACPPFKPFNRVGGRGGVYLVLLLRAGHRLNGGGFTQVS